MTRWQLIADVWQLNHEPETNSVEVHVSRLRAKLARAACDDQVQTAPEGGYRLATPQPFLLATGSPQADALDDYLRVLGWAAVDA